MKKSDLVARVAKNVPGLTHAQVSDAINEIFEGIAEALKAGDSYSQDRFGTFKLVERAPRKGRNPQNGETVDIPAKKAVKLVVSGHLKSDVNS